MKTKIIAVIPARFASSRLPGKPLSMIGDKPMIQHTYESTKKCSKFTDIIVAVDNEEVKNVVESFGGKAVMTSVDCKSGSDRVAEVVKNIDCDIICNIQGDEPFVETELIEAIMNPLIENESINFATAVYPVKSKEKLEDPNLVKCVRDKHGFAMYFSRYPIPYNRSKNPPMVYGHHGIYSYRKQALLEYVKWEQTPLETTESLEQLRILENGEKIYAAIFEIDEDLAIGVDNEADLKRANEIYKKLKK